MRGLTRGVFLVIMACAVCACSNGSTDKSTPSDPLHRALTKARAAGADKTQLDILSKSTLAYVDYESAMNRYFDCLRKAGYSVNIGRPASRNGVTLLEYTVGAAPGHGAPADGKIDPVSWGCYTKYARFVDTYWQTSTPDALAFEERREKALAPDLRVCLSKHGVDVPTDASFTDMIQLSTGLLQKTKFSCMDEIGYSDWQG